MRFDPEKERKKKKKENGSLGGFPLSLLNLLATLRGGGGGSAAGKRVVFQGCLPELFDISSPPAVYNPDTCSWADPPRANGQDDRRRCGESGQSAAD